MRSRLKSVLALALGASLALTVGGAGAQAPDAGPDTPASAAASVAAAAADAVRQAVTPAPSRSTAGPAENRPTTPSGPRLSPGTPIPPAELEVLVDGLVRGAMSDHHIAGVAVSV